MKKKGSPAGHARGWGGDGPLLRFLGSRSVFQRVSLMMVAFFMALALFVMIWINSIVTGNQRVQMGRAALARLEAVSLTMDQALADITQSMEQLMWNYDFIHYMISPNYYDDDPTHAYSRDYRILSQLHSVQENNPLVKQALFYSPISGWLYRDSTYSVLDAEGTYEWFILQKKGTDLNVQTLQENSDLHTTTLLYNSQGSLFVIQKLDIGNHIGTLVFELDIKGLADLLNSGRQGLAIYPYDSYGNQALKGCVEYLTDGKIDEDGDYVTYENVNDRFSYRKGSSYLYTSENTGWQYMTPVDMHVFQITPKDTLVVFLPVLLALLGVSALLTQYLRAAIYQPINRLMNQLGTKEREDKNEFDYLESVYSDAREQQEHLEHVLSSVAPDVLESLIRGILFGRRNDYETVRQILEGIDNPISAEGLFVVCVCMLQKLSDRPISLKEWNLYYISLQQIAGSLSNSSYRVTAVRVNENTMALAVCFGPDSTEVEARRCLVELRRRLLDKTMGLPYSLFMQAGQIYTRITDLRESFSEAMERVRYQQYVQSDELESGGPAPQDNQNALEEDAGFSRFHCHEQCRYLVQLASVEEKNQACDEAIQMVEKMCSRCKSLEEFREESCAFLDELIEQLIVYPLTEDDHAKLARYSTANALHSCTDKDQIRRYITSRSVEILQMISGYARKNRYKYVNQAKEYIAANYSNSSLSLNDVAEHCSISASYLSELFNEVGGEKFSAYLAKYRVEKARQLQSATNLTVKEIGYQCGFNSSQNFIRVYKKYTGVTPGQYKGEA